MRARTCASQICFVGDEGFRDLSRVDPQASQLLADAIASDQSQKWIDRLARIDAAAAARAAAEKVEVSSS